MEILIERNFFYAGVGRLTFPSGETSQEFYTLEHPARAKKIPMKTGIPLGVYDIVWEPSAKFKCYMPYLKNVPGFQGIMIHPGNTLRDTHGCILIGRGWSLKADKTVVLLESKKAYAEFLYALTKRPPCFSCTVRIVDKK